MEKQYEPFDSITLCLKLTDTNKQGRSVSLSIRDRAGRTHIRQRYHAHGNATRQRNQGIRGKPGILFRKRRQHPSTGTRPAHDGTGLEKIRMEKDGRRGTVHSQLAAGKVPNHRRMCQPRRKTECGFQKASNLKREVNVWAMFVQNRKTIELKQPTRNGTFTCKHQKSTGNTCSSSVPQNRIKELTTSPEADERTLPTRKLGRTIT